MLTNAKYCEEHRRYFLDALDTMYEVLIISEKAWREERSKSHTSGNDIDQKYVKILQSGFTNLLLTSTDKMEMAVDPITKAKIITATSPKTSLKIILNTFKIKLAQQEAKLVAIMIQKLAEGESGLLSIHLTDLAARLGKLNIEKARESINASLQNLRAIDLKHDGVDVKGKKEPFSASLCQTAAIKNSIVFFEFGTRVENYLLNKSNVMPINNDLFSITSNRVKNPYACAIGLKIFFQANLNRYKDEKPNNVFSISIKNLLEICQRSGLPSYKKVSESAHQVTQRIIEPVERELDLLMDKGITSKWYYEDKKGNVIKDYIEIANDNPESDSYSIEKNKKFSEWKNRKVIIELPPEYLKQIPNFNKKKVKNLKKNNQKIGEK